MLKTPPAGEPDSVTALPEHPVTFVAVATAAGCGRTVIVMVADLAFGPPERQRTPLPSPRALQ